MLPVPLLIIIGIVGAITAILVIDSIISVFKYYMIKRRTKNTPPLNSCDESNNVQIIVLE
jgi:hypothetical protein